MTIASAVEALAADLLAAAGASNAATTATRSAASLTGAQARALALVVARVVDGSAGVADAETVADTIIEVALSAQAPVVAALVGPAAIALADLVIERLAAGEIRFDPNPVADAQTRASSQTHGHWQR